MKNQSRSLVFYVGLLLSLFIITGCSGGSSESSSSARGCSSLNARIFGGEVCSQTARSPVVALVATLDTGTQSIFCTGALVTVDDILTSAHCFEGLDEAISEGTVVSLDALVGGIEGELIPLVSLGVHPGYRTGDVGSPFDLAMATLQRVPSPPIGPLPILLSELTLPGSDVTAFGYGTNDNQAEILLKAANFTVSDLDNGNLIVVGDGQSSVCPGDSGGPVVYITRSGITTVAGVNSFIFSTPGADCVNSAAKVFGFVDLQFAPTLDFIFGYAPDVSFQ